MMRKAFALFLILLLAGSGCAVIGVHQLTAPCDEVVYTQTVLYGDPRIADGLAVHRNIQYNDHLLWSSDVDFTTENYSSKTDFQYSDIGWNKEYSAKSSSDTGRGLEMFSDFSTSYSASGGESDKIYGLRKAWKELFDETAPGTTGRKTIRIADYVDYYPFMINIDLLDIMYGYYPEMYEMGAASNPETDAIAAIQEYFKIPVLENEYYSFSIDKDINGNDIGGSGESIHGGIYQGDTFPMSAGSVVADDAIYFCINNRTEKGALIDTSQIPGGFGIYVLPYGQREKDGETYPDVFAEDLDIVYPVDPETMIMNLSLGSDRETLFLHTIEDGMYRITFLCAKTGQVLQKMDLTDYSIEDDWSEVTPGEDYFVVRISDHIHVVSRQPDGSWKHIFETEPREIELEDDYPVNRFSYRNDTAFDGERLAICGSQMITDSRGGEEGCGFFVAVYTADGLQYYGQFDSTLQQANKNDPPRYGYNLHPLDADRGSVQWKQDS